MLCVGKCSCGSLTVGVNTRGLSSNELAGDGKAETDSGVPIAEPKMRIICIDFRPIPVFIWRELLITVSFFLQINYENSF